MLRRIKHTNLFLQVPACPIKMWIATLLENSWNHIGLPLNSSSCRDKIFIGQSSSLNKRDELFHKIVLQKVAESWSLLIESYEVYEKTENRT